MTQVTGQESTAAGEDAERVIGHWIDGRPATPEGRTGDVFDPALGLRRATVQLADRRTVDDAVASAARALETWREVPITRRAPILYRFRDLLIDHIDEVAAAISAEHGKVPSDAAGEIHRGLEVVEMACSVPAMLKGEHSEQVAGGVDTFSVRQPVGICAGITPFNFPAMVPLWMFPIALACGNAFVLKPSERDPSASLILARLLREAGLPDGVFNVVQGDKETVDAILDHPGIDAVSFVGSTPIARYVYSRASAAGKRVQALGGAKNHLVVMPDSDLGQAADAVVSAAFGSTGQRCMAVSVAIAVEPVGDALIEEIRTRVERLRVGPATDESAEMGPLTTAAARDRVQEYIEAGLAAGADLVADGRLEGSNGSGGYFLGPTVFDRVTPGMPIYDDEVFGPLLAVTRVGSLDDAIELINGNPYGNGAAIFTRSGGAARRFQRDASAGMIGINVPIPVPTGSYSFGGWKDSLFGDTHIYGPDAYRFYTRAKVVTSRWPDDGPSAVNLAFPNPG